MTILDRVARWWLTRRLRRCESTGQHNRVGGIMNRGDKAIAALFLSLGVALIVVLLTVAVTVTLAVTGSYHYDYRCVPPAS